MPSVSDDCLDCWNGCCDVETQSSCSWLLLVMGGFFSIAGLILILTGLKGGKGLLVAGISAISCGLIMVVTGYNCMSIAKRRQQNNQTPV